MRIRRTYDCLDCGVRVTRWRDPDQPLVCEACSIQRSLSYNDRLHAERLARRDTAGTAGTLPEVQTST